MPAEVLTKAGRGVIGSALEWGSSGWQFKSARPDKKRQRGRARWETLRDAHRAERGEALAKFGGEPAVRQKEVRADPFADEC